LQLEKGSDDFRAEDARIKFYRESSLYNYLLSLMFPLMAIVAYHIMMLNENPAHAMDIAYSILVASMLIDEGHKAMIILAKQT